MTWRRALRLPGRVPVSLRVFFRGAFLALALATIALALAVLQEEKQLSWRAYQDGFQKNHAQIAARLRHPTGQLALLNPGMDGSASPMHSPLVLPFSAIDFDDKAKALQAVEMAGCQVQYPSASLCVAVGSNPAAGGFIYVVGSLAAGELVAHEPRTADLTLAHRARITVTMRGQTYRWLAPFEQAPNVGPGVRGRLTGFAESDDGATAKLPARDFRGWLWQDGRCLSEQAGPAPAASAPAPAMPAACPRRTFFSIRLPIDLFHDDLLRSPSPVWPPADLDQIQVRTQILAPGVDAAPLFDSQSGGAQPPFALRDLTPLLQAGETLRISRVNSGNQRGAATEVTTLKATESTEQPVSPLLARLIRLLPADGFEQPISARDSIATPLGSYTLELTGSLRGVNRALSIVATRVSWFVAAMLVAIFLTWLAIEIRMVRRIARLTKRAAAVSQRVKGGSDLPKMDLSGLRSGDELGLLADVLSELMQRVNSDLQRERIRAEQERDQWQAVGHEIMSPMQSLMVLHADAQDPSHRYITRMQQALRILYGSASPSEAFQGATLSVQALNITEFLRHVAHNAAGAGVPHVELLADSTPRWARADEYSLEDVMTHVLGNANRYRTPGTPIRIELHANATHVEVAIHNQGPAIATGLIDRVFEYGVTDQADSAAQGHRGQGLFVAKTYMAKMGGGIAVRNTADGVCFTLTLQLAPGEPLKAL